MAAGGSTKVVLIAFVGNALIAVSKLVASAITGSSAMFAEGIHSVVDSGNQLLLLYGMKRARRPADAAHPFGYGKEVYFWSFVVAILLFSIGAGISIYEGVHKISDPHKVQSPIINFIVIGLAVVFEGYALHAAVKEMNARRGAETALAYVRRSKDAPLFVVLLEDAGALIGLLIAGGGLLGALLLDMPVLDGVASVMIGCLLACTAVLLAVETKGLLLGEAADPEVTAEIEATLKAHPAVLAINEVLTMHMGPDDVFCALSVDFKNALTSGQTEEAISELEDQIRLKRPEIKRIFIEAQSVFGHMRAMAARSSVDGEGRA